MDRRKGKRIALQIFLSSIFALLVTYMGFWVYDIIYQAGAFSNNQTEDVTFACVGYVYDIPSAAYKDGTLEFILVNKKYSDYTISSVGIVSDLGDFKEVEVGRVQPGREKRVKVEINANNTVKIYPKDCDIYGKLVKVA